MRRERGLRLRHSECQTPVGPPSEGLELNASAAQTRGPDYSYGLGAVSLQTITKSAEVDEIIHRVSEHGSWEATDPPHSSDSQSSQRRHE